VDDRTLARELGIPVVLTAARQREGITTLLQTVHDVATGAFVCRPRRVQSIPANVATALDTLAEQVIARFPGLPNARWVALRLLEGDQRMIDAVKSGELAGLVAGNT
jgi:ferrous iron transport protein B